MSSDLFSFAQNHVAVEGGNNPQALLALITGREASERLLPAGVRWPLRLLSSCASLASASPTESDPLPQGLCTFLCL